MFQAQLIQLQEKAAAFVGLEWNLSHWINGPCHDGMN
jgi:hypothetical protein